jgi:hypothetical protein
MGLLEPHVGYRGRDGQADLIIPEPPEETAMSETAEVKPEAKGAPAPSANSRAALDQLARIEDKMARIEEKFARQEAQVARAQDSLDRAATRVEAAARSVDAAELATEVGRLREKVEKVPRLGGLVVTGLVTALSTALLFVLLLKFFPGLLK